MSINGVKTPPQPMVVVAFFVVIGLYVGWWFDLDLYSLLFAAMVSMGLYIVTNRAALLYLMMLFVGGSVSTMWQEGGESLDGRSELYSIQIISGNRAYVEGYRGDDGVWRDVRRHVFYGADSALHLSVADRVSSYCRMREHRTSGYIYLSARNTYSEESPPHWSQLVNSWGCRRLEQLGLSPDGLSLVESMLLGRRDLMSDTLRESYNRSGAAHLLAVSGLHLAIIYTIVNVLLRILHLLPYGHIVRNLLVICIVWGYAAIVGMSASVVRAAIMLSVLQFAHLLHRSYTSLNALAFAAMLMAILNPSILFDVGFLLSVTAIFAIILWATPLLHVVERWSRRQRWGVAFGLLVESTLSVLVIGIACSMAVIPLISHTFGYVTLWGVLLNPLLIMTTYLILVASLVWLLFGLPIFAPVFGAFIEAITLIQNHLVHTISTHWHSAVDLSLDIWELSAIYLLYALITLLLHSRRV